MIVDYKCYLSFHKLREGMSVNIRTNTEIWTNCLSYWQELRMGPVLRKAPSAPEAHIPSFPFLSSSSCPGSFMVPVLEILLYFQQVFSHDLFSCNLITLQGDVGFNHQICPGHSHRCIVNFDTHLSLRYNFKFFLVIFF